MARDKKLITKQRRLGAYSILEHPHRNLLYKNHCNMGEENSQMILNAYKSMTAECQSIASKISELTLERDEHKLVVDTLTKLELNRKAFRLVGGVLVERTVEEVLPAVSQNYEGVRIYQHRQNPLAFHKFKYSTRLTFVLSPLRLRICSLN